MRLRWFLFFFKKSVAQRKGRVFIASASVMLAVTVVTGMVGLTSGVKEKLGAELKAYGANIIVSPRTDEFLPEETVKTVSEIDGVEDASGQFFGKAGLEGHSVEIIGVDMGRLHGMGWRLFGRWPEKKYELVAGINLRDAFGLKEGGTVLLEGDNGKQKFTIAGFFEKGGAEDNAFLISLSDLAPFSEKKGVINSVLVRGRAGDLEDVARRIKVAVPSASVSTVRQVARAEESLLSKIQLLMIMVTGVVLLATTVSVASTMGANVFERRGEIGLMKAIGARRSEINSFYIAEGMVIGISGGLSGFLLGVAAAQAISKGAFNSFVPVPVFLPFISLSLGVCIAVIASFFPVMNATKCDPAVILRGE